MSLASQASLDRARAVADAVLYEGYLLYPYRATSRKNQVRWQFGVLGPPGAADHGVGEEPGMATQCLLVTGAHRSGSVTVRLRFLQLQSRMVEKYDGPGRYLPVPELTVDGRSVMSWDEAVEHEVTLEYSADDLRRGADREVTVAGGTDVEPLTAHGAEAGRVVRRRWPVRVRVTARGEDDEALTRLTVSATNVTAEPLDGEPQDRDWAIRRSLIGVHMLLEAGGARFVSVIDPPAAAEGPARRCHQKRCWPVLTGTADADGTSDLALGSPIILYDFPEVAEQSAGDLFDSTEIDEILTLRVMTMTEQEKAEARATDPRAREIIDRCDQMSPESLQLLHGVLRNPYATSSTDGSRQARPAGSGGSADVRDAEPPTFGNPDVPWWDPAADEAVDPELDAVVIDGVSVSKGSLVRVHPSRRADAQDLFFQGQLARVTAVLSDVDGGVHVALVLADDPAADLHDWYGRYWYFAPDELAPVDGPTAGDQPSSEPQPSTEEREESRP